MSSLESFLGSLLVGTWLNTALFVLEVRYAINYLLHPIARAERWYVKATVAACLVTDSITVAGHYAAVYLYCVTNWGNIAYLPGQHQPTRVYSFASALTTFMVQNLLIYRNWKATRIWPIAVFLCLLACTTLGAVIRTTQYPQNVTRAQVVVPVVLSLVSATCTDIGIAICLVCQLHFMHSATTFSGTRNILRTLMRNALSTGTILSIGATVPLIAFLIDNASPVVWVFGNCLGRLYTFTLLYNLHAKIDMANDQRLRPTFFTGSMAGGGTPVMTQTADIAFAAPGAVTVEHGYPRQSFGAPSHPVVRQSAALPPMRDPGEEEIDSESSVASKGPDDAVKEEV